MPRLPVLLAALALGVCLGGCLPALPRIAPEAVPVFRPEVFFAGRTEGLGTLDVRGRSPEVVRVQSLGTPEPDGTFRLHQTIRRDDDAPSERTWILRSSDGLHYTGTLTEAKGEVEATVEGSRLHIHYRMGTVTTMTQNLTLQPGGQLALNLATVRVLGIPWARLTEQIRRVDAYTVH